MKDKLKIIYLCYTKGVSFTEESHFIFLDILNMINTFYPYMHKSKTVFDARKLILRYNKL